MKTLKAFLSPMIQNKTRMPVFVTFIQYSTRGSSQTKQEKEIKDIQTKKEKIIISVHRQNNLICRKL